MTDLRKAAEMALEALEGNCTNPVADPEQAQKEDRAIQALRQALAESANSTTDFVEQEWDGPTDEEYENFCSLIQREEAKLKGKNGG